MGRSYATFFIKRLLIECIGGIAAIASRLGITMLVFLVTDSAGANIVPNSQVDHCDMRSQEESCVCVCVSVCRFRYSTRQTGYWEPTTRTSL